MPYFALINMFYHVKIACYQRGAEVTRGRIFIFTIYSIL